MAGPAKSGFAAGRSSNGTARSSMTQARKPTAKNPTTARAPAPAKQSKADRMRQKMARAEADLQTILEDAEVETLPWDNPGDPPTGTLLGTSLSVPAPRRRHTDVAPEGEDSDDGAPPSAAAQRRTEAKFEQLSHYIGVENDDYNAELANRVLLRAFLSQMMELIPEAIGVYRRTHKEQAGYVVAAFMTQARDANSELRMVSDAEGQAVFITQRILAPAFANFANVLLQEGMALRAMINKELPASNPRVAGVITQVETMMRNLGAFMDATNARTRGDITAYLNGDLSFMQSETAGGKRPTRGKRKPRDA